MGIHISVIRITTGISYTAKTLARVYNAVVCVQHPVNEGAYVAYVRAISTNTLTLYKYGSAANTLRWFVVGSVS